MLQGEASSARSLIAYMSEASLKKGLAWTLCSAMALRLSNTTLKLLGVIIQTNQNVFLSE